MLQMAILLISAALIGVDQLTKWLAVMFLQTGGPVTVWEGVFSLKYTVNTGAAWNLFDGQWWLLTGLTSLMLVGVLGVLLSGRFRKHRLANFGGVLVFAGGVGNLIDRFVHGYVIDFLKFDFIDFPIFNVADCFIVVGAITLFIYFVFLYSDNSEQKQDLTQKSEVLSSGNDDDQAVDGDGGDEA